MSRFVVTLVALCAAIGLAVFAPVAEGPEAPERRPNVLLVFTDDQPVGAKVAIPKIERWFREGGRTFRNAYVTTPLCCPSRATILTGLYAHNHGVEVNAPRQHFDHDRTVQAQLRAAGYRTGFVGKYLNGYRNAPRFERFAVVAGYEDRLAEMRDGVVRRVSRTTPFVFSLAARWAEGWSESDQPWFVAVSPFAPHYPFTARPDDASRRFPWRRPPSFEAPPHGKPDWVRRARSAPGEGARLRRDQLRTLGEVDDGFADLIDRLEAAGELDHTLIIFTSDNGMMWGQHGLTKKAHPYQESVRVPMYARGPGIAAGSTDRLVANLDITPTIYEAAGVEPDYEPDGRSLTSPVERGGLLLEHPRRHGAFGMPAWTSLVTKRRQYIRYATGEQELYDLENDPFQLTHQATPGSLGRYRRMLKAIDDCSADRCP